MDSYALKSTSPPVPIPLMNPERGVVNPGDKHSECLRDDAGNEKQPLSPSKKLPPTRSKEPSVSVNAPPEEVDGFLCLKMLSRSCSEMLSSRVRSTFSSPSKV